MSKHSHSSAGAGEGGAAHLWLEGINILLL